MENSLCIVNRGMIIEGVTFHEQKDLKIIFNNDGNINGILYLFTVRAIGDQVYLVSRDIPDRIQRWRGVPFLQYNNSCFFGQ